jgi:hypothetical protein
MDRDLIDKWLEDTGGNRPYSELIVAYAQQAAAEQGKYIPQRVIDEFYSEVSEYRKRWEKRINQNG